MHKGVYVEGTNNGGLNGYIEEIVNASTYEEEQCVHFNLLENVCGIVGDGVGRGWEHVS